MAGVCSGQLACSGPHPSGGPWGMYTGELGCCVLTSCPSPGSGPPSLTFPPGSALGLRAFRGTCAWVAQEDAWHGWAVGAPVQRPPAWGPGTHMAAVPCVLTATRLRVGGCRHTVTRWALKCSQGWSEAPDDHLES